MIQRPDVDDATVAYIHEHQKHFEDLKQVAAQLAGLLVLAASGANTATPAHPVLESTGRLLGEAADAIRRTRVPVQARRHHEHLVDASSALERASAEARGGGTRMQGGLAIDSILVPLRAGYASLQQAANALPGFEMVAFEQGCCGSARAGRASGGYHPEAESLRSRPRDKEHGQARGGGARARK